MRSKSGHGLKERFRARRERRRTRLVEGTKARASVDYGAERYGGQYGSKSSPPPGM